jgi:hypothetical protein
VAAEPGSVELRSADGCAGVKNCSRRDEDDATEEPREWGRARSGGDVGGDVVVVAAVPPVPVVGGRGVVGVVAAATAP